MKLGVNVDHVATLRQARLVKYPNPLDAVLLAKEAGCDSIVIHIREDRRHAQEYDAWAIKRDVDIPLNLEMAVAPKIVEFALKLKPQQTTLVPERRQELTTEGGLDLVKGAKKISKVIDQLKAKKIIVSVFIDPKREQISMAKKIGADLIEINSGRYSEAKSVKDQNKEWQKIKEASKFAKDIGFFVACGHGLDYVNVKKIVEIKEIEELNIGHSIVSQAVLVGFKQAVREMMALIKK